MGEETEEYLKEGERGEKKEHKERRKNGEIKGNT